MAGDIKIEDAGGNWVVRAGGAVIGESDTALRLIEDGYPDRIYFPREDIAMAFLDRSDTTTHCPHKGDATYFSIQTKSMTLTDAGWSYEEPKDAVAQIAGHICFAADDVAVEEV